MKNRFHPLSKPISELSIDDFLTHPIWTWADEDDESLVIPLEDINQDHDTLFILANFILGDGTKIPGFIAVRANNFSLYLMALAGKNNRLFDIPLQLQLRKLIDIDKIQAELNKEAKDIFPIRYETTYPPDKRMTGYVENFLV
jgi:hypothetical protein